MSTHEAVSGTSSAPVLAEKAPPGLHAAAFDVLSRVAMAGSRVLDLGAGTGAWAKRLIDRGYRVTAVDRDASEWGLSSRLLPFDLNHEFADMLEDDFDVVTGLEVIEHLENPRAFLRQCHRVLGPRGIVLITTPNIENVAGRLRFLATGQLRGFDRDPRWNEPTHITPIQTFLFEKMCSDTGFTIEWRGFNRPTEVVRAGIRPLALGLLRPFLRGTTGGDHHIFLLRRAD
jgi:SAM-dependent methyltransferase